MITLLQIIWEEWNNPIIDGPLKETLDKNLKIDFNLKNPFSLTWVDLLINEIETHLKNTNIQLSQNNIQEAYKELYWYTWYQINLWEFLNEYKNLRAKYKMILDYLTEILKTKIEEDIKQETKKLYKEKNEEILNLEKSLIDKKLTTIENKFLTSKLQWIEDKYNALLLHYTPQKINNTILNRIKKNQIILELQRKINILEKITWYFDFRYKGFQEQINSYKKIIDNLVFLYNNTNKQWR